MTKGSHLKSVLKRLPSLFLCTTAFLWVGCGGNGGGAAPTATPPSTSTSTPTVIPTATATIAPTVPSPPPAKTGNAGLPSTITDARIDASESAEAPEVFNNKCKTCHSVAGVAGPMAKLGGPLDGVGAKHDEAWLKAYIENPKSKMPESKMPTLKLSADELNAVVSYLSTLKTPAAK